MLLYFVATHEIMFAVVALFGCLNFARNVVFYRPYLKEAFQRIKKLKSLLESQTFSKAIGALKVRSVRNRQIGGNFAPSAASFYLN